MQIARKVAEGSGADSKQGLWQVLWHNARKQTSLRAVLVQMADEVPVQMADEVSDGSAADSRQRSGVFW